MSWPLGPNDGSGSSLALGRKDALSGLKLAFSVESYAFLMVVKVRFVELFCQVQLLNFGATRVRYLLAAVVAPTGNSAIKQKWHQG